MVAGVLAPSVPLLQHCLEILQDLFLLGQVALSVKQLVDLAQLVDNFFSFVLDLEGLDLDVDALLVHRGCANILSVAVYLLFSIAVTLLVRPDLIGTRT